MKNISCNMNVWVAVVLLAVPSACSRNTPAVTSPPPLEVNNIAPSPPAPDQTTLLPPSDANDVSSSPTAPSQTPSPPLFDVNDVSFLWPVPKTKADVDALISMDDMLSDDGASAIWPEDLFKEVIAQAETVKIAQSQIKFPDALKNRHTWKVAGIRVNPASLGASEGMLKRVPEIPGIRMIAQPVTLGSDGTPEVHDFAAHVVYNFLQQPNTSPQPDKAAFRLVINDLKKIKALVEDANVSTKGPLDVHPGFKSNVRGFRQSLRYLQLKNHLSRARFQVVSFMGIRDPEPWIFFSVKRPLPDGSFAPRTVGGFPPAPASGATPAVTSQMLTFSGGPPVVPSPVADPETGAGVSTALLFGGDVKSRLDTPLFAKATRADLKALKVHDLADVIANPVLQNTLTTDCVSCHTETTRRFQLRLPSAPAGIIFKLPDGISGVAEAVLPRDQWNVRNFGWGLNFFDGKAFAPTVTQRAANEAAESADFINRKYLSQEAATP
jgi:hypothetical protein